MSSRQHLSPCFRGYTRCGCAPPLPLQFVTARGCAPVGEALRLWVDGARTEAAGVGGTAAAFDAVRLGGSGATAYDGALDEVWLAQTAITADEAALVRYCPL